MVEIARLLVFAGFATLAAITAFHRSRFTINLFLAYTLTVSVAIGVTQLDAWPFSTYRLANQTWSGTTTQQWSKVRFFALDSRGREWDVDPSAWSPAHMVTMQFYFRDTFPKLGPADRRDLGRFLMQRAEAGRQAIRDSRHFGNERLLGPFAAPDWALTARYRDASPEPYVGIRVVREFWRPIDRLRDPKAFTRLVKLEYRPQ